MRSRRRVSILAVTGLLLIVDPLAAARAGAGGLSEDHRYPLHLAAERPRAPRKIAHRKVARRIAPARAAAPRPARPPTMCEAVVAAVAWPRGWRKVCTGSRPGLLGLTNPNGFTTLYVRPDESLATMHVVALHEAGHAWDFARLDPARIARWCAQRGCNAAHFFSGGSGGVDWAQPGGAEDWAAVWDACHGGEYHRSYLGLAAPTAADCARQNALVGYRFTA
jgi:hypothetical protein